MNHSIALNFEDGVTRFIECREGEKVLDAAFRQRINLPMDCADGVCGTCKCRCESGAYDLGEEYVDDALSADEAARGLVLTCQMVPSSDCVIAVPLPSTACKTGLAQFEATLTRIVHHQDAALEVELETDEAPVFLPGQYVNITVPGSTQTRSYSFSSSPGEKRISFLIKRVPGGLMSAYLDRAVPGERLQMSGPLGSFYLRSAARPLLFLAGGTGLAPFLSMLEVMARSGAAYPVHLIYGVTRDEDLVLVEQLAAFAEAIHHFSFSTVVATPGSSHPKKGYVTDHLEPAMLRGGDVDVYLCGPPPMVDAVRTHFDTLGITPASFRYEKFTPNAPAHAPVEKVA
jgi:benzoate/toluate 1,2-dioxygenase reductase component